MADGATFYSIHLDFAQVIGTDDTDNNKVADLVCMDFKSFVKVSHEILLLKVNAHGMQDTAARWIRIWFACRRQRV